MEYSKFSLKLMEALASHPDGLTRAQLREKTKPVTWSSVTLPGGIRSGLYKIKKARQKKDDIYTLTRQGRTAYDKYKASHAKPSPVKPKARTPSSKASPAQVDNDKSEIDYLDPIAASHIEAMQAPVTLNRALNKFIIDINDRCAEFLTDYPNREISSDLDKHNNTILNKIIHVQELTKG